MHSNYERLFEQLTELVSDENVHHNLDESLKARVERLIEEKGKPLIQKKANELCKNDRQNLFGRINSEDMSQKFEQIVIGEKDSRPKLSAKTQTSGSRTKMNKQQGSGCKNQKSRERGNSNDSGIPKERSQQKYSKDFGKVHSRINSGSKLKTRLKSKEPLQKSKPLIEKWGQARQRSGSKMKVVERGNKQNVKIYQSKADKMAPSSHQKTEPDSQHAYFTYSKNKSNCNVRGREVLKTIATLDTLPSRFSVSHSKKASLSLEKQKQLLSTIQKKKEEVTEEKWVLEDSIRMLQQKINKEKTCLNLVRNRITKTKQEIAKVELTQKDRSVEVRVSRKKSESVFAEAKQIGEKIVEANQDNDILLDSIAEERYLIEMYKKVIDEMKSQVKVEKEDKTALKKKLGLLKKSQRMLGERCASREALSDQLFSSMKQSLKKWG